VLDVMVKCGSITVGGFLGTQEKMVDGYVREARVNRKDPVYYITL
jgi:hypothetical protein